MVSQSNNFADEWRGNTAQQGSHDLYFPWLPRKKRGVTMPPNLHTAIVIARSEATRQSEMREARLLCYARNDKKLCVLSASVAKGFYKISV